MGPSLGLPVILSARAIFLERQERPTESLCRNLPLYGAIVDDVSPAVERFPITSSRLRSFPTAGGAAVSDSLSIIVPVRNAEVSLFGQVEHLLETLPDFTPRFEILIVDDGSTDHTAELARELARRYPQVRWLRHAEPRGLEAAVAAGRRAAVAELILVQEDPAALSGAELRRIWTLHHAAQLTRPRPGRAAGLFRPELLDRLANWGQSLRQLAGG